MYALDSNAFIHALKGKGEVQQRLKSKDLSEISVPSIVVYELELGTVNSSARRRRELNLLFGAMTLLPFDRESAEHAARIRYSLEKAGNKIGPLDLLVAGTVLAHGAILVTHNIAEFSRVPGLQMEDWF